jgi:oxygen-independent coproporphyrinogen-3 oxidase
MNAGLYIHIPFCEHVCGYCDFYRVARRESQIPPYLEALKKESSLYSEDPAVNGLRYETLYFGGGTPSLLTPEQIDSLIQTVFSKFNFKSEVEITVEANPGTVDLEKLKGYRAAGVNRLSLGIQSFQAGELKLLDRIHSGEVAVACFNDAREAGFENISIDLIFALPHQTLRAWKKNLAAAVALGPNHISAYNLTFEEGTRLTRDWQKGKIQKISDDVQAAMHLTTIEYLSSKGYNQYEISNYAQPNFHSRHNQKYWDGSPYLGLGTSAHSFVGYRRFWNFAHLGKYHAALNNGKLPVLAEENLAFEDRSFEKVFLNLRQRRGIHLGSFEVELRMSFFERYLKALSKFFSEDFRDRELTRGLISGAQRLQSRLLEFEDGFLRLTTPGVLVCDAICAEFL